MRLEATTGFPVTEEDVGRLRLYMLCNTAGLRLVLHCLTPEPGSECAGMVLPHHDSFPPYTRGDRLVSLACPVPT